MANQAEFDQYAENYSDLVNASIRFSGETKDYFARKRIQFLSKRLFLHGSTHIDHILDFGCGTGEATPPLLEILKPKSLRGVDVSEKSIDQARSVYGSAISVFALTTESPPTGTMDLAYCSGVFHHIPLNGRAEAARYVLESVRPGGWFALWEHNPWNPGTRLAMAQCPFDHDAMRLSSGVARTLLREAGFDVVETRFYFLFPNAMRYFRPIEDYLTRFPLCAQYLVLARRPAIKVLNAF